MPFALLAGVNNYKTVFCIIIGGKYLFVRL